MSFQGPLFVVGSPRSGTKLLRTLLNRNPHINLCAPESHFIPHIFKMFGDDDPATFNVDIDAMFEEFDKLPFQVFARSKGKAVMTRADFDALEGAGNWSDALEIILRHYGEPGKSADAIWGDKTPSYVLHMPLLKKIMPNARFVHIIRDPRDVAVSVHAAWKHNMMRSATKWARNVAVGRRDGASLGPAYHEIYYEDMLGNTTGTFHGICDFLGVPFAEEMTTLARPSENIGTAAGKTYVDASNLGKFRNKLASKDQKRIEEIVFTAAQDTPYTPDFATAERPLSPLASKMITGSDAARTAIRFFRKRGMVDGLKMNIGNLMQRRRGSS